MIDPRFLLSAATSLYAAGKDLVTARRDRRQRLAQYFSDLAQLLEEAAASLRNKDYPHGACGQLHESARLLPRTVKGLIDPKKTKRIQADLFKVWKIEQLHAEISPLSKKKRNERLAPLDEAAGKLRALSAHLRVI